MLGSDMTSGRASIIFNICIIPQAVSTTAVLVSGDCDVKPYSFRSRAERKARGRIIPAIEAVWVILYPPWASARLLLVIGGDKGFFPIEASQRRVSEIEGLIRDKSRARRALAS